MNKAYLFVLGGSSTFLLSLFFFIALPRYQVGNIDPAKIAEVSPYNEGELKGREVYIEYGCVYCHSQQVRDPAFGTDQKFGWGDASAPAEYAFDRPHLLGTMRTGPDLSNIGTRQPSSTWHHLHLYDPRLLVNWSIMPGFEFLYSKIKTKEKPNENAIPLPGSTDTWIIPHRKADHLVAYLLKLQRGANSTIGKDG